ncbi:MAG TPA: extracellular solute-binding protein [Anaerolineae bacterium]|nr:extracellular solute-binding protein [Anaerolineae bacterium]
MKNKNWYIMLIVLLFGAFALSACGGGQATEEPAAEEPAAEEPAAEEPAAEEPAEEMPAEEEAMGEGSIAVLLPDSASSARWEADDRRFFEEAFDAAGVEYTIVNAEGDARTQQTQAEQAITNGAKVLLLVNLDSGSGAAIIAQARDAGVKVIDYDRLTIEGPGADVYVSFDNVSVGRLMGETLEPIIDALDADPKRVVQLNGSPTDNNATLFREGYFSVAEPHYEAGDWELVDDQAVPDWDNQQALVIFEQILTAAGGDVDAVFAANDGLANSVISALKSQGLDPVPLSGQDATVAGIQNILSDWQTMTVYKPIKLEAEAAAEAAIALLNGEDVTALTSDTINNGTNDVPFIKLTPLAVTKDNIEETVIADGFRTWEEICVGDYEALCAEAQGGGDEAMAEEPEISLTIWADDTRAPILQDLADDFEAEYGVALIVEEIGFGDIRDQMTIAAPAGEGPDIIVGAHDWLGELVSNGVVAPIDLGDKADLFLPNALEAFRYEGELYGMPNAIENVALFINTDMVPECPTTWDDVFTISEELSANNTDDIESNTYGFVRMEGDPYHFFPIQTAFGGYVFGVDENGYNPEDVGIDSEGSLAAAEWYDAYVKAGLQPAGVDWDTMHLMFENGQAAMIITGPWALDRIRESGVNYAICDLPGETEPAGAPFLGVQGFMVNAFSEDPLLAQIFLTDFVATDEVMQAFFDANPRPSAFIPVLEAIDDPDMAAFGSAGKNALPMPAIPEMASVWEAWGNAVTLISQQGDAPDAAFMNAAEQIRTTISEGQ